jgi:hypothetical protein
MKLYDREVFSSIVVKIADKYSIQTSRSLVQFFVSKVKINLSKNKLMPSSNLIATIA